MKNSLYHLYLIVIVFMLILFGVEATFAQQAIPVTLENKSKFADSEIYVAIVGEDLTGPPGMRVWVDMKTGQQMPMSSNYNTLQGPVYGGNKGPGNNGMYANCFTKLSDIPNKKVNLAGIQGCRIFMSVGSPLYLYFFGASGSPSGYASPNHTDPTDPNKGIAYEIIELTYNQYGFWGNTTRVDSYNYAMALELQGDNGLLKTGELLDHATIGSEFLKSVPTEFKGCYNATSGVIMFPTKTEAWADGTIGTMPNKGPYVDYMKPYIDAIWSKYANEDLIFNAGDAGIWKGRVINEQLVMVCQSGGFLGRKGIIDRRPTTQEAFEGKGVLDRVIQDAPTDLMIQAQICAAITRHVIDVKTPNVGQQNWSDPSKYYLESPCNHYAKFWHQQGVSYNKKSYGFAYDDVWDQSSTLHSPHPSSVKVIFGGYAATSTSVQQTPYLKTMATIPGTIEAEKYDDGGEGVAFHDVDVSNSGGAFRQDAVDIESNVNGFNVGYIAQDEWLEYTVNCTQGVYTIEAVTASIYDQKTFELSLDGVLLTTFVLPNTGGWSTFASTSQQQINVSAGQHVLRLKATSSEFNVDKLIFKKQVVAGVEDVLDNGVTAFPNPINDFVLFSDHKTMHFQMYQMDGLLVSEGESDQIDVRSIKSGNYILKYFDNENHYQTMLHKP